MFLWPNVISRVSNDLPGKSKLFWSVIRALGEKP